MKAAVCREFGAPLSVEEIKLADPESSEVRVKLGACAICHSDITFIDGGWGGALPAVFGHEAAGVVEQTGYGVTRVSVGDTVVVTLLRSCGDCYYCSKDHYSLCETIFALDTTSPLNDQHGNALVHGLRTGAFAEQVVVHESQVLRISESVPMSSAALLSCGVITGFGAVKNVARVIAGSSVATIGTGGIGVNCIQGAAICGSKINIAIDLVDEKIQAAQRLGATHTINPVNGNLKEEVERLTDGRGLDYVFVAAGSAIAVEQALTLVRRAGMVILVGMTPDGVTAQFETLDLANDAIQLVGSKMGQTHLDADIPALVEYYLEGTLKLDELVSKCYPLEEINDAITAVKEGEALRNVIIFDS